MGFLNFKGGRESNTEHSQNYKELIKDYFRSKGYTPFRDSIVEGCLTDIILKNIELDGQIETHVEVKWETFTVFSNKKILREFWEYMYLWLKTTKEERFFFWIFARKISNLERHK
nr:hypothetical protein [Candidatus Sigynarchaeota archaeon]